MLHYLPLYFLIGDSPLADGLLAGNIDPNILNHSQLPKKERFPIIKKHLISTWQVFDLSFLLLSCFILGEYLHTFLLVLPVDEFEFFELAAIMTDGDYISFETLGE